MKVSQAIQLFREYHRMNSKKNTLKNYEFIFTRFQEVFGDRQVESITTDEVLSFLTGFPLPQNQPPSAIGMPVLRLFSTSSRIQSIPAFKTRAIPPCCAKCFVNGRPSNGRLSKRTWWMKSFSVR